MVGARGGGLKATQRYQKYQTSPPPSSLASSVRKEVGLGAMGQKRVSLLA